MLPCSAIIPAGGESKRFNGANKALMKIGSERSLDRIVRVLEPLFDEMILVSSQLEDYLGGDLLLVTDHFDCRSALTGIHAGLFAAQIPMHWSSPATCPWFSPLC
jgi:molybdopterin-guanine dinucleotide biosynthesis protein A